ncbi:transketolase family protein [Candidatus Bathyarchaeota archaeon]|nr:transketolase family protein [Candidatus Bathyarchaeota archaeon]MBL7078936.1 transketolase family protein [Candidatus Bathyarchaeota archaeon]
MEQSSQLESFGRALVELGREREDIVVLDPDVASSTKTTYFAESFPSRFVRVGISEQDMLGIASGLAAAGKTPIAVGFAMFIIGRGWEQIANSIARQRLDAKIVGTHAGLSPHADGESHQMYGDVALMRTIPNMRVVVPGDAPSAVEALRAALEYRGPVYIRLMRGSTPTIYGEDIEFEMGRANVLREGSDATVIANGIMLSRALTAAEKLIGEGIDVRVIDMHTVKPLDTGAIEKTAKETGAIVTAEEHSIIGGLGSAVAETLAETAPTPMERIGIRDRFGESSRSYPELLAHVGLTPEAIAEAVHRVIERR